MPPYHQSGADCILPGVSVDFYHRFDRLVPGLYALIWEQGLGMGLDRVTIDDALEAFEDDVEVCTLLQPLRAQPRVKR